MVLADTYWMPLACFFDWRRFAVFVPEARAAETAEILAAIASDAGRIDSMQAELLRVRNRKYFVVAQNAQNKTDAFDLHILEAFMRATGCGSDNGTTFKYGARARAGGPW